MPYQLNAANMNIAPYHQMWQDNIQGRDHTGRPIFGATKNVVMEFDAMTVASYAQFSVLHGTSLTSVQILNVDGGSFTTYSQPNVFLEISNRPKFETGNVTSFTVTLTGLSPL